MPTTHWLRTTPVLVYSRLDGTWKLVAYRRIDSAKERAHWGSPALHRTTSDTISGIVGRDGTEQASGDNRREERKKRAQHPGERKTAQGRGEWPA